MSPRLYEKGPLLYQDGCLSEFGYAFSRVKDYSKNAIKAKAKRIREWDYYSIVNNKFTFSLVVMDAYRFKVVEVLFIDLLTNEKISKLIKINEAENLILPSTTLMGNITYKGKDISLDISNVSYKRNIKLAMNDLMGKEVRVDVYLKQENTDSMVNIIPFNQKKKYFLYDEKINLLASNGYIKVNDKYYECTPETYATYDSSRGAFPRFLTHYKAVMNIKDDKGNLIAFNLGYGLTNDRENTENVLYYNDETIKFNDVRFSIPINAKGKYDYLSAWSIASESGDISVTFMPLANYEEETKGLGYRLKRNQTFGTFSGTFKINDRVIEFNDAYGYALKILYKW